MKPYDTFTDGEQRWMVAEVHTDPGIPAWGPPGTPNIPLDEYLERCAESEARWSDPDFVAAYEAATEYDD
jgi:hypothetical protein